MKRTLVLAALTLASVSVYAANPQPSFQDSAPAQSQPVSTETAIARGELPKPSLNDSAAATTAQVVNPAGTPGNVPAPSFAG